MHSKKYEELMLRFAQELHEVGVTDTMKGLIQDQYEQHPNVISVSTGPQTVSRFTYRHNGYLIEATKKIELTIKKCT